MIYALTDRSLTKAQRKKIANAIESGEPKVIRSFVNDGSIVHVGGQLQDDRFVCIYCRRPVRPSVVRGPKYAASTSPWHFEHVRNTQGNDRCPGRLRGSDLPDGIGIRNPSNHGCYVELDHEHLPKFKRTKCKCTSYCHRAKAENCR
jgi:hypothetical protein